ncbi:hypothetical protein Tco_0279509, partial [Tanacetum coccineum]
MARKDQPVTPVHKPGEGPSISESGRHLVGPNNLILTIQTHSQHELYHNDSVFHFVVQNFDQINAMYCAFSTKRKEITLQLIYDEPNNQPPKQSRGITSPEGQKKMEENILNDRQPRRIVKPKPRSDSTFYNNPFTFKETEKNVLDLVASPLSKRIRDYEMPDKLKVPTNLRIYDGLSDRDDHL